MDVCAKCQSRVEDTMRCRDCGDYVCVACYAPLTVTDADLDSPSVCECHSCYLDSQRWEQLSLAEQAQSYQQTFTPEQLIKLRANATAQGDTYVLDILNAIVT